MEGEGGSEVIGLEEGGSTAELYAGTSFFFSNTDSLVCVYLQLAPSYVCFIDGVVLHVWQILYIYILMIFFCSEGLVQYLTHTHLLFL